MSHLFAHRTAARLVHSTCVSEISILRIVFLPTKVGPGDPSLLDHYFVKSAPGTKGMYIKECQIRH